MKKLFFWACCNVFVASLSAQAGALDPTFGQGGLAVHSLDFSTDIAWGCAVQADGKIIQAGQTYNGSNSDFGVIRCLPDGQIDPGFGVAGKVILPIGMNTNDYCHALALQSDQKILLGGQYDAGLNDDWALARLLPSGAPDPEFGNGGIVLVSPSAGSDDILAMTVQPDGKIISVGHSGVNIDSMTVARFMPDGSLDANFGIGGLVKLGFDMTADRSYGYAVALQSDGHILVAGNAKFTQLAIARLTPTGALDNSFGQDGKATFSFGGGINRCRAIGLLPDGKIVLGGSRRVNIDSFFNFAVVRLLANGDLDGSFGNQGLALVNGGADSEAFGMLINQADQTIILAGNIGTSPEDTDFGLARVLPNGAVDLSFGLAGVVRTNAAAGDFDQINAIALQNGRLIAGGYARINFNYEFTLARYQLGAGSSAWEPLSAKELTVYPNPGQGRLFLRTHDLEAGEYKGRILNSAGMLLSEQHWTITPNEDMPFTLPAGVHGLLCLQLEKEGRPAAFARLLILPE